MNEYFSWRAFHFVQDAARIVSTSILDFTKRAVPIVSHILIVTFSAGIALSLPLVVASAQHFLDFWAQIENEKVFLVSVEVAVAMLLIVFFNFVGRSLQDQKLAAMARSAGLVYFSPSRGRLAQRRVQRLKKKHGIARSVMIIGSTGYRTFADPPAELRAVLENCLDARIMLLNPESKGARTRAKAIADPAITHESLREQLRKSIDFLKRLRMAQKTVKLKLYSDPPHLKLAILGDYIWIRHYHTNLDVQAMPEYVFMHNHNNHGLYTLFYQYFMRRWESPDIPEYDFETDEIVYGGGNGGAARREKFLLAVRAEPSDRRDGIRKGAEKEAASFPREEATWP